MQRSCKFILVIGLTFLSLSETLSAEIKVKQVATGSTHACAIVEGGALYCWGGNDSGQLGLADSTYRSLPTRVATGGVKVISLSTSYGHTCAIFENGLLKCWGDNSYGQLGLGSPLKAIGNQFNQEVEKLPAINLGINKKAARVWVGNQHSCVILEEGTSKCWGYNREGELGYGDTKQRGIDPADMGDNLPTLYFGEGQKAIQFSVGYNHTCAILQNNSLKCWGNNNSGQLGLETELTPIGTGFNHKPHQLPIVDLGKGRKVVSVATREQGTCAILDSAQLKCWGVNTYGILGIGNNNSYYIIGNMEGQMGDNLKAVNLMPDLGVSKVSCGYSHCCAILENNAVKCWGDNSYGQLGLGNTKDRGFSIEDMGINLPYVNLGGNLTKVTSLAVSGQFSCAILGDESLRCWGNNDSGELGTGKSGNIGTSPNHMGDKLLPIVFSRP